MYVFWGLLSFPTVWFWLFFCAGCTDLSKHRVHPSGISGPICRRLPTGALHCGCCSTLWFAGILNKRPCDNWPNSDVCLKNFPYLGPYRSQLSNSELWIWSKLLHQRGFPGWPFSTENALRADQEPAHCHVCIIGQSYTGHQACLHPGE